MVIRRKTLLAAAGVVCLCTVFVLLNIKTIHWPFGIIDSPIILAQAILYTPIEYFAAPAKYQFLSYNNFTPWVTLSWDVDYALFQLEAWGYRMHHLTSAALMLGLVYGVLYRLTHSIVGSTLFTFAVLTLPATFAVIDDLVNRHYLEGMIFSLLSFYCVQRYISKQSAGFLLLSILFYGVSITAKEVFIPLPGVLFFLFTGSIWRKILLTLPYAGALLGYLVWRLYMLGGSGGYTSAEASLNLIGNTDALFDIVLRLMGLLFVTPSVSILMLGWVGLLLIINFGNIKAQTKWGIVVAVFGLVLPLLALLPLLSVGFHSPRWLFAPSMVLLLFFAYLCAISKYRVLTWATYVLVLACSVEAAYLRVQEPIPTYVKGKGKVYEQILRSDPNRYVLMSNFSQMAAQGQAIWVYIAKLHNGVWGTLMVSDVGQLRYHDTVDRTAIRMGRKKVSPESADLGQRANLNLIESARYDPDTGSLTFNFVDTIASERCFVYLFGQHNGYLYGGVDCKQWQVQYRELSYQIAMTGYELAKVSIAVWSESRVGRIYSRSYKISELIDLSVI